MSKRPKLVLAGVSGFIGSRLVEAAVSAGYQVTRLVRSPSDETAGDHVTDEAWDPTVGELDESVLAGAYGVVCLNGAGLFSRWWTDSYKKKLYRSRIDSVVTIVNAIERLAPDARPEVFLSGSAVGYYGPDSGDAILTEESHPGTGFLSGLCVDWEREAHKAEALGARTVLLRTGLTMGADGGMLGILQHLYRAGLGGQLGDGQAWMATISVVDHVRAMLFALRTPEISGPINVVAPDPVRNEDWNKQLGEHLHRPAIMRVPAFAMRLGLGQIADEAALASQRAYPAALEEAGFRFTAPSVADIFRQALPRT